MPLSATSIPEQTVRDYVNSIEDLDELLAILIKYKQLKKTSGWRNEPWILARLRAQPKSMPPDLPPGTVTPSPF